jgi:hypothetical protein
MVSEARLPIRCCPEVKNGKPSGPSSPLVRIATALGIYKNTLRTRLITVWCARLLGLSIFGVVPDRDVQEVSIFF